MAKVAIVTDSTADLTPAQAAAAGVRVVPLYLRFGEEEFQAGVDITTEGFWERLVAPGAPFPTTAQPTPATFADAFAACFSDGYDAVVCLLISSKLSGTFQSASVAAQGMPGREIHIVDSQTTTAALAAVVLVAAEAAATGASGDDVEVTVRRVLDRTEIYFAVDTLEYLKKGGRLSAARAAIGTILSVKPIITIRDGEVLVAEQQRTRGKARERVVELIAAGPADRLAVLATPASTEEEVAAFRDRLVSAIPGGVDPSRVTVGLVGATTGPHLGPGVLGAAVVRPGA